MSPTLYYVIHAHSSKMISHWLNDFACFIFGSIRGSRSRNLCLSVRLSCDMLSILHISLSGLSQVFLSFLNLTS